MREQAAWVAIGLILMCLPSIASGQSTAVARTYDDCIVLYADRAPSPQAAVILQRACFYKYRYGKDYVTRFGNEPEHRKLAKIYTPAVCDCILEKLPGASPDLPAARVLDGCVKAPKKQSEPISK